MPNNPNAADNLKPFGKKDKRINRLGRPRSFDALRKLAQKIAASDLPPNEKGEALTRVEAMLTVMSSSRNPADRKTFLEYAFGKPKDEVDVNNQGKVVFELVRKEIPDSLTNAAPAASDVSEQSRKAQSDSSG